MTDLEFDILDELYFVIPYADLLNELGIDEQELKRGLLLLIEKGWVKCLYNMTDEVVPEKIQFEEQYSTYCYLASKTGLFAHNSI